MSSIFKSGILTGTDLGIQPFLTDQVKTMNVHHEWYLLFPIATFHGSHYISFHRRYRANIEDLNHIIELHKQWKAYLETGQ